MAVKRKEKERKKSPLFSTTNKQKERGDCRIQEECVRFPARKKGKGEVGSGSSWSGLREEKEENSFMREKEKTTALFPKKKRRLDQFPRGNRGAAAEVQGGFASAQRDASSWRRGNARKRRCLFEKGESAWAEGEKGGNGFPKAERRGNPGEKASPYVCQKKGGNRLILPHDEKEKRRGNSVELIA